MVAPAWPAVPAGQPAWHAAPARNRSAGGRGKAGLLLVGVAVAGLAALGLAGAMTAPAGPGPTARPSAALPSDGGATPSAPGTDASPPPPAGLSGTLRVGETQTLGSQDSEPGQPVTLSADTEPVAGLEIVIDGDAYAEATTFTVSTAPITGVDGYGGAVTPISPLITIENGGAYAASPIVVTVPVARSDGAFAMGFYLRDDGTLEALPLVAETASAVTIATRHFSSFFIAEIAEAALPTDIGTGFRVGEDDFAAPNYGSYLAPGGHCTGQSVAEVWYFANRKAQGAPQLRGLTDNLGRGGTPAFTDDDRDTMRIASSIQLDADFVSASSRLLERLMKADADRLQWLAFRYAMYVTGQPQLVGLYETGKPGGHEIVAYAATATGLWVADPNAPGRLRSIDWDAKKGAFVPYASGEDARSSRHHYDLVGMDAQSALFDWGEVADRWSDVDAGIAGIDRFGTAVIEVEHTQPDGSVTYDPLSSGPITTAPRLSFSAMGLGTLPVRVVFFLGTTRLGSLDAGKVGKVPLADGTNDLGVLVEAQAAAVTADDDGWRFVDFQRFALEASAAATPAPTPVPTLAPTPPPAKTPGPGPTVDCSHPPTGGQIERLKWELACGGQISP